MKEVFEGIYKRRTWYNGSGSGSHPLNTVEYRNFLQQYIAENGIKKVIDIGCGDWQFSCLMDWANVDYLGIDVVDSLVVQNQEKYGRPNINFQCGDARLMHLPPADLIVLKDVFQHWAEEEINSFLVKLGAYRHILSVNTWSEEDLNSKIENGGVRSIDLGKPPFGYKVENLFSYESIRFKKKITEVKVVQRIFL